MSQQPGAVHLYVCGELIQMELCQISEVHPHVYRGKNEDGLEIVLKYRKRGNGFFHNFIMAQAYKNEVCLLSELAKHEREMLVIPQILKTDFKTFMVQTALDGSYLKCAIKIDEKKIAEGLREFHAFCAEYITSFWWKLFQSLFMSVGASIHRGAVKLAISRKRPICALISLVVFYKSALRSLKQGRALLHHRDLINHDNSFILKDGRFGLIDFGNSRREKKWIFMDLVDLSIDYNMNVNVALLLSCADRVSMLCDKPIFLKDQIKVSLLRRLLHPARLHGPKCEIFLLEILLDEEKFETWYRRNIECQYERSS